MTAAKASTDAELLSLLEEKRRRQIRDNLHRFCRFIDIPGAPINDEDDCDEFYNDAVTPAEHHDLLNSLLMRLADGDDELDALMVFMPPGSAKSTYGTVTFPTWYMGLHPNEPIICTSYGAGLAKKFGRKCRQICSSEKYHWLMETGLQADNRAVDDWSLDNGASYMCGGILSGLTGNRAKGIVIDDPVKGREDADSPTIRDKTWDAYNDDLKTRLKPGGWQLVIQTRWHEDDLSGRILPKNWDGESGWVTSQQGKRWYVLCLEAECTRDDDPLGREIGEFLWTDWFPVERWLEEKASGSRRWASLFQQRPKPAEGALIQRAWCRRYSALPPEFLRIVQSWDTAYKPEQINDPSVCTTWGQTRHGYYLLDVFRQRMTYPDVKRAVVNQWLKFDRPMAVLIEDKASGQSLLQELREGYSMNGEIYTPPVIAIDPQGVNKVDRLIAVSSLFESGQVWLPDVAAWLMDFEMELFGFPLTTHDDQVDSTSQFLKWAWASRVLVDYHAMGHVRAGLRGSAPINVEDDTSLGISFNDDGGFLDG
ncbi:MAG: phage terminase large subunit [Pseudomonadota bacterium]